MSAVLSVFALECERGDPRLKCRTHLRPALRRSRSNSMLLSWPLAGDSSPVMGAMSASGAMRRLLAPRIPWPEDAVDGSNIDTAIIRDSVGQLRTECRSTIFMPSRRPARRFMLPCMLSTARPCPSCHDSQKPLGTLPASTCETPVFVSFKAPTFQEPRLARIEDPSNLINTYRGRRSRSSARADNSEANPCEGQMPPTTAQTPRGGEVYGRKDTAHGIVSTTDACPYC